jgi:enoyl-CoA hydratase
MGKRLSAIGGWQSRDAVRGFSTVGSGILRSAFALAYCVLPQNDGRAAHDAVQLRSPTSLREHATMAQDTPYETIIVETKGRVGLIRLNRPNALNALNAQLIGELSQVLDRFEDDAGIGCIVITGSDKAFAAGADIKEMQAKTFVQAYKDDFIAKWYRVANARKPVIAAVAGFALGGGCELAMMCDIIIAADTARFGQPEIKLGVMPGAGGTQRLIRQIGKAKAMEMCLTGRMMDAAEAERANLVARVVPAASLMEEAMKTAETIASMSLPVAMMTKETVNRAYETTLAEGIRFERRVFHSQFALVDQKEGMAAFVEKRKADFKHE